MANCLTTRGYIPIFHQYFISIFHQYSINIPSISISIPLYSINIPSIFHQYSINIPSIFHQYPISIPLYSIISSLSHHFSLLNPHHSLPLSLPPSLRHPVFTKDMRRGVLGQMTVAFFATWTGNSGWNMLKPVYSSLDLSRLVPKINHIFTTLLITFIGRNLKR